MKFATASQQQQQNKNININRVRSKFQCPGFLCFLCCKKKECGEQTSIGYCADQKYKDMNAIEKIL